MGLAHTMPMKNKTMVLALALTLAAVAKAAFAAAPEMKGTLNVTVMDENGAVIEAPVYIYGEHKTRFVGGQHIPGTATFEMEAGDYKISTALIKKTGDYIDRFASHEAHIRVAAGDNTVVTLKLLPIDSPMAAITTAELKTIGISKEIARNLR